MKLLSVFSGGMDSTTVIPFARDIQSHDVTHAINFTYGSKHNDREQKAVDALAAHYGLTLVKCRLDFIAEHFKSDLLKTGGDIPEGHYADPSMKRTVVPFRNGIMLSIAAGLAESLDMDGILLGNHVGDHAIYPDCREDFTRPMAEAILNGTYKGIKLVTPFGDRTKTQIAKAGGALHVPYELTYSCYKGGEVHCGVCGTCFERKEAFRESGVTDPTEYLG